MREFCLQLKESRIENNSYCAISNSKDCQVSAKKAWLAERMDGGLGIKKGDALNVAFELAKTI